MCDQTSWIRLRWVESVSVSISGEEEKMVEEMATMEEVLQGLEQVKSLDVNIKGTKTMSGSRGPSPWLSSDLIFNKLLMLKPTIQTICTFWQPEGHAGIYHFWMTSTQSSFVKRMLYRGLRADIFIHGTPGLRLGHEFFEAISQNDEARFCLTTSLKIGPEAWPLLEVLPKMFQLKVTSEEPIEEDEVAPVEALLDFMASKEEDALPYSVTLPKVVVYVHCSVISPVILK